MQNLKKQYIAGSNKPFMNRRIIPIILLIFFYACPIPTVAQATFPVNGVRSDISTTYAFTHAVIYTSWNTKIENATLIIKDDKIVSIGTGISIPQGAVETDLSGKTIYPSFIDAFTSYGMPESKQGSNNGRPQFVSDKNGAFGWNEAIRSEFNASENFTRNENAASAMRNIGFGMVYTFKNDGIARGSGCVVTLGNKRENELMIKPSAGANYSFDKGSSSQDYPGSLMGSIALLRQTYYDAAWYKTQTSQVNFSLKAFNDLQGMPQFFDAGDKWNILRADKIGDEFGIQYVIKSAGNEYQRINEIKNTKATLIVPVNYPAPFNTQDAYDMSMVSTADMMHWYYAPSNLYMLYKSGVPFCITMNGCDAATFMKNLRKAIEHGLPEQEALKALTQTPATVLNIADKAGSLKPGMLANFFISSGNIFDASSVMYENWIQGIKFEAADLNKPDIRGAYKITAPGLDAQLVIEGDAGALTTKVIDKDTAKVDMREKEGMYTLVFEIHKEKYNLTGWYDKNQRSLSGKGYTKTETGFSWSALHTGEIAPKSKSAAASKPDTATTFSILYPFMDYGVAEGTMRGVVLFRNATVWTCENDGILAGTDVLVVNGKIEKIGKNLPAGNARVIDATGKHLTPGIIDEHSHIAIWGGVNEATQSVTSEVRIGDVVWPEDINIYRQLSGGVTCSHLLHGSANTIGGQTQLIKLRWGKNAEEMKFEGWDGFIKFALGENVKQANWGERQTVRFPQTRMGVEQVLYDAFTRAKEYKKATELFALEQQRLGVKNTLSPPRKDLELDALVEILDKKRFITCHSYIQSEINMLMHVGDSMGFKVNTFTHILEGYKVADKMKAHGANASNFADWWAYKFEVYEAIPYNSAIMTRMGLNVAVNSDDAEMARRLNQEAAKSMKYGGLKPEEAIRLCTINPAKMLHIDNRTGSIKTGKDADLVLWSDDPLSIYARALYTMVDGTIYFDASTQDSIISRDNKIRGMIMQKMTEAIRNGEKPNPGVSGEQMILWDCESEEAVH
jgi:imidazolonepropionase-like amidohydrolase